MTRCAWSGLALALLAVAGCHRDDSTLTAKVQAHVNNSINSPTANVEVQVSNGVVTLSGVVPSAPVKARAEQAAQQIEGVKGVRDELTINAGGGATFPSATPTPTPAP